MNTRELIAPPNKPYVAHHPPSVATNNFWHTSYFAPLDGLRALSLLLVIGGHVKTTAPLQHYFSGGLGVGIFFVLSGFLITTLLLREDLLSGHISLTAFYIRRAFRILPPYLLTLGVYLLIGQLPSQHTLRTKFLNGLPYFLTLRNEYIPGGLPVAFTHSWSLSVEEKFYCVWPLVLLLLLRKGSVRALGSFWAILPLVVLPLCISTTRSLPVAYFSLLAGCSVAFVLHALRKTQQAVLAHTARVPVAAVLLLWALSYFVSLGGTLRVSFILCTAFVLPILLLKNSSASRLLGSRACVWIGKRTYSMYLFHAFCLTAVEERWKHQGTAIAFLATVAIAYLLSLGVASVVYVMLEKPAIAWGRELASAFRGKRIQPAGTRERQPGVGAQRSPAA